eukprot:6953791-Alexandrium_andersonii.AAC.1
MVCAGCAGPRARTDGIQVLETQGTRQAAGNPGRHEPLGRPGHGLASSGGRTAAGASWNHGHQGRGSVRQPAGGPRP